MSRAVELELGDVLYTLRVGYFDLREGEVELSDLVTAEEECILPGAGPIKENRDMTLTEFLMVYADYHAFSVGQAKNNLEYEVLELLADQLEEDWDSGREGSLEIKRDLGGR